MAKNKGIAIMMVLSAIMIISMIALEFVYSSNVNYRMAINEKERLQAYYLAESALNLMKIELKIDKQTKSALASSPVAQYITADLNQPLCQQFPFSTALLRAFFIGGQIPGMSAAPAEEGDGEDTAVGQGKDKSATTFETETAQEFLSFNGDFDGSCADEQSKLNLNYFSDLDPSQQALAGTNQYDIYKAMLINYLKQDEFQLLFKDVPPEKIEETVRNIADWVDKNDQINDFGNTTRGVEEGIYHGDIKPKNAKFWSLEEVNMVEGVKDDWFMPLADRFTIYGGNKVNVCLANDDVVWALILAYASQNQNATPINPKNEEMKKKLLSAVHFSCSGAKPEVSKIAADLDSALGVTQGSSGGFANMITTETRYYALKLSGQVGNSVVNIKTVLDISNTDPKKWKILYYKVY